MEFLYYTDSYSIYFFYIFFISIYVHSLGLTNYGSSLLNSFSKPIGPFAIVIMLGNGRGNKMKIL